MHCTFQLACCFVREHQGEKCLILKTFRPGTGFGSGTETGFKPTAEGSMVINERKVLKFHSVHFHPIDPSV